MRKVDRATVQALQLRAPRASTLDTRILRRQIQGGEIFGAFSEQERETIWGRLHLIEGLIPTLFSFFKDLQYLQACVDCVRRLTRVSLRETVFTAMEKSFTGVNQRDGQVVVQMTESTFVSKPGSLADQIDLGYQQLYAYTMRHFLAMPRETEVDELLTNRPNHNKQTRPKRRHIGQG
jgi:hypothetical protein